MVPHVQHQTYVLKEALDIREENISFLPTMHLAPVIKVTHRIYRTAAAHSCPAIGGFGVFILVRTLNRVVKSSSAPKPHYQASQTSEVNASFIPEKGELFIWWNIFAILCFWSYAAIIYLSSTYHVSLFRPQKEWCYIFVLACAQ